MWYLYFGEHIRVLAIISIFILPILGAGILFVSSALSSKEKPGIIAIIFACLFFLLGFLSILASVLLPSQKAYREYYNCKHYNICVHKEIKNAN